MAIKNYITCDLCGMVLGEKNHHENKLSNSWVDIGSIRGKLSTCMLKPQEHVTVSVQRHGNNPDLCESCLFLALELALDKLKEKRAEKEKQYATA